MNFGVQNIVSKLVVIGQYFDIYIAILMSTLVSLINVQDGINVQVGNFVNFLVILKAHIFVVVT